MHLHMPFLVGKMYREDWVGTYAIEGGYTDRIFPNLRFPSLGHQNDIRCFVSGGFVDNFRAVGGIVAGHQTGGFATGLSRRKLLS